MNLDKSLSNIVLKIDDDDDDDGKDSTQTVTHKIDHFYIRDREGGERER